MPDELKREALAYDAAEPGGKLQVLPTKPMATQRHVALGVAHACEANTEDPTAAAPTLVAVISNGTAVLGLGNIGPLAAPCDPQTWRGGT